MKVGKTLSYGNGRLDDGKALAELGFEVKDFFSSFLEFMLDLFTNSVADPVRKCADRWLLGCGYSVVYYGYLHVAGYVWRPWNTYFRVKKTVIVEMFSC